MLVLFLSDYKENEGFSVDPCAGMSSRDANQLKSAEEGRSVYVYLFVQPSGQGNIGKIRSSLRIIGANGNLKQVTVRVGVGIIIIVAQELAL